MYKLVTCLLMLLTCHESTCQRYYYKDYGDQFDIYYGPYALGDYKEMRAPKLYKNEFSDRGDRPGVCESGEFLCNGTPYPIKETKHFECKEDFQCPSYYKCCKAQCFQHKICQPAIYDENSETTSAETYPEVPVEEIKSSKSIETTRISHVTSSLATKITKRDTSRTATYTSPTSTNVPIVTEDAKEIPDFMYSKTNTPTIKTTQTSPKMSTLTTTIGTTTTTETTRRPFTTTTTKTTRRPFTTTKTRTTRRPFTTTTAKTTLRPFTTTTTKTTQRPFTTTTTKTTRIPFTTSMAKTTRRPFTTTTTKTTQRPFTTTTTKTTWRPFTRYTTKTTRRPFTTTTTKTTQRPFTTATTKNIDFSSKLPQIHTDDEDLPSEGSGGPPDDEDFEGSADGDDYYSLLDGLSSTQKSDKPISTVKSSKRTTKFKGTTQSVTTRIPKTTEQPLLIDDEDYTEGSGDYFPTLTDSEATKMTSKQAPDHITTPKKSSIATSPSTKPVLVTDDEDYIEGSGNENFSTAPESKATKLPNQKHSTNPKSSETTTKQSQETTKTTTKTVIDDDEDFAEGSSEGEDAVGIELSTVVTDKTWTTDKESAGTKSKQTTKIPSILLTTTEKDRDFIEGSGDDNDYVTTKKRPITMEDDEDYTEEIESSSTAVSDKTSNDKQTETKFKKTTSGITKNPSSFDTSKKEDRDFIEGSGDDNDYVTTKKGPITMEDDEDYTEGIKLSSTVTQSKETAESGIIKNPTTKKEVSDFIAGSGDNEDYTARRSTMEDDEDYATTKRRSNTMEDDEDYIEGSGDGGHSFVDEKATDTSEIQVSKLPTSIDNKNINNVTETSITSSTKIKTTTEKVVTRIEDDEDNTEASGDMYSFDKEPSITDVSDKLTKLSTKYLVTTKGTSKTSNEIDRNTSKEEELFTFTSNIKESIPTSLNQVSDTSTRNDTIIESKTSSPKDRTQTTKAMDEDFTEELSVSSFGQDKATNETNSIPLSKITTVISSTPLPPLSLVTKISHTTDKELRSQQTEDSKELSDTAKSHNNTTETYTLSTNINEILNKTKDSIEASKSSIEMITEKVQTTPLDNRYMTSNPKELSDAISTGNKELEKSKTEPAETRTRDNIEDKILNIATWPLNLNLTKNKENGNTTKEINDAGANSSEKTVTEECNIEVTLIPKLRKKITTITSDTDKSNDSRDKFSESEKTSKTQDKTDEIYKTMKKESDKESKDKSSEGNKFDETSKQSVIPNEAKSRNKSGTINEHNELMKNVTENNKNKFSDDEDDNVEGSGYFNGSGHDDEDSI